VGKKGKIKKMKIVTAGCFGAHQIDMQNNQTYIYGWEAMVGGAFYIFILVTLIRRPLTKDW